MTFFDCPCQDICPVLSAELREADADLGPEAAHVVFLTVNTDPVVLPAGPALTAAAASGLGTLPNWYFLTSSLSRLNAVWRAYGVDRELGPRVRAGGPQRRHVLHRAAGAPPLPGHAVRRREHAVGHLQPVPRRRGPVGPRHRHLRRRPRRERPVSLRLPPRPSAPRRRGRAGVDPGAPRYRRRPPSWPWPSWPWWPPPSSATFPVPRLDARPEISADRAS